MKRVLILIILCMTLLLTGCAPQDGSVPVEYQWASVEGSQINQAQSGEQFYFNLPVDEAMIEKGVPVKIKVNGSVSSGSVRFELRRPDGQAVWNSGTIGPGEYSMNTEYSLPADVTGTYTLGLVYGDQTQASYNLSYYAFKLSPAVLIGGTGMMLVALAFVAFVAFRRQLGWRYLFLGALFWFFTVAVKFAFAIPVNPLVYKALGISYENIFSPANLIAYLYIGALTGIFEAGLAWLVLRKSRWGSATWSQALVFGIGFGAFEALLLGAISFGSAMVALTSPDVLPVYNLGELAKNSSLVMALAPIVERFSVVLAHIFSCVLIFYAIARGESKWAWLSIVYKSLLDAPAGFAAFWGVGTPEKIWTIEAIIAVFGLIGLWGTIQIARRYPRQEAAPKAEEQPAALPA